MHSEGIRTFLIPGRQCGEIKCIHCRNVKSQWFMLNKDACALCIVWEWGGVTSSDIDCDLNKHITFILQSFYFGFLKKRKKDEEGALKKLYYN